MEYSKSLAAEKVERSLAAGQASDAVAHRSQLITRFPSNHLHGVECDRGRDTSASIRMQKVDPLHACGEVEGTSPKGSTPTRSYSSPHPGVGW